METICVTTTAQEAGSSVATRTKLAVKVIGAGGAGASVIEALIRGGFAGESCAVLHADAEVLARTGAGERIQLPGCSQRGDTASGAAVLAEDLVTRLRGFCSGAQMVCLVAGLGGRTGTDMGTVIAQEAKAAGASVLAFVTLPFECEGSLLQARARWGLEPLRAQVDGVLCLPNQKLFQSIPENTRLADTCDLPTKLLTDAFLGIWRMLARPGRFKVHLEDITALLLAGPEAGVFATAEGAGINRSAEVVERLLAHPLLAGGEPLRDSAAVLVGVAGGADLTMAEVNFVMKQVSRYCEKAHMILGTACDESLAGRLTVTLLTSSVSELVRTSASRMGMAPPNCSSRKGADAVEIANHLLPASVPPRAAARLVPPAPQMTLEEMQQLLAQQEATPGRRRRTAPRLRQTQLQLEIISKGRFDKSEPTVHKGEDLDLPTYLRRGVVLN